MAALFREESWVIQADYFFFTMKIQQAMSRSNAATYKLMKPNYHLISLFFPDI